MVLSNRLALDGHGLLLVCELRPETEQREIHATYQSLIYIPRKDSVYRALSD